MMGDVVVAFGIVVSGITEPGEYVVVSAADRDLEVAENDRVGFAGNVFVAAEPFEFSFEVDGEFPIASDAAEARLSGFEAAFGTGM